jgi:NitT/TauT family transport system permease protein
MKNKPIYASVIFSLLAFAGIFVNFTPTLSGLGFMPFGILALIIFVLSFFDRLITAIPLVVLSLISCALVIIELTTKGEAGAWGYWLMFWGFLVSGVAASSRVGLVESDAEEQKNVKRLRRFIPPAIVPFVLLLLWQGAVIGNQVPRGIFPSVNDVYAQLRSSFPVLLADSYTTFVKEVAFGFTVGFIAGFLVGVAIALSTFLQRGFLPFAAAFGAVPIVGLAPVLGRAFGVDWESKAAVVVITTFFPVVLNTVQGLTSVEGVKLELLKAYAAKPLEVFFKLRLPNALPYIFNALKLSVVLSVISVIVAEFLIPGPPVGLGQRISLSARRGAYDVVFAAIFVSSVISIILYGILSWLERRVTGWHPSFRETAD